jgi:3-oxoacyl-[acyl-carrier-protein] synthase-3
MNPHLQDFYEATMQRLCRTFNLQEFRNQLAGLTIGCGAVATILCRSDLAPPGRNHRLTGAVARCAPYAWPMCTGRYERANTDPTMVLHGLQVFRQAWEVAQQELGLTADNIDVAVPHQVGKKVHRLGATYCGFDVNKAIATYPYTGNVGPASIGIALSIAEKEGRVKEGMRVCLSAFGSGLNCIFAEVMW